MSNDAHLNDLLDQIEGETKSSAPATLPSEPDDEILDRLAALSRIEYDREREATATRIGIRTSTLDAEVEARRPARNDTTQGCAISMPEVEPCRRQATAPRCRVKWRTGSYIMFISPRAPRTQSQ
jgi:hypothetical protein